jgi:hypothetical protein
MASIGQVRGQLCNEHAIGQPGCLRLRILRGDELRAMHRGDKEEL